MSGKSGDRVNMQRETENVHEATHGYIKARDKEKIQNRLRRIDGQVRGVQRMVDEEAYCVDVLTQISSIVSAMEKVVKEATFKVSDMSCGHCKAAVEGSLGEFSGVERSNADLEKGIVGVRYDEDWVALDEFKGTM